METAKQIQCDTLSILLANRIHSHLDIKSRSTKIAKCCKVIRDKTKDNILYEACRSIINANSNGNYKDVIRAIGLTEVRYFMEYTK
jgi:hypothetical protein